MFRPGTQSLLILQIYAKSWWVFAFVSDFQLSQSIPTAFPNLPVSCSSLEKLWWGSRAEVMPSTAFFPLQKPPESLMKVIGYRIIISTKRENSWVQCLHHFLTSWWVTLRSSIFKDQDIFLTIQLQLRVNIKGQGSHDGTHQEMMSVLSVYVLLQ